MNDVDPIDNEPSVALILGLVQAHDKRAYINSLADLTNPADHEWVAAGLNCKDDALLVEICAGIFLESWQSSEVTK